MMQGTAILNLLERCKHWLNKASVSPRQRIFLPEFSRKIQKRLETVHGPLACISPQKPKFPLPWRIQWEPLPDSTTPPLGLHATARQLVDAQTAAIHQYLPGFFKNPALNVDYEPAYTMNRQQQLAVSGLAFLARCFERQAVAQQPEACSPFLILNSPVAPALLPEGELTRQGMPEFSTIFSPVRPLALDSFKKHRKPLQFPKTTKPTVLMVMSAPVHLELARPALESLESTYTIVLFFANPDKISAALRQTLSQRYFTIDAHTVMPTERLAKGAYAYFNQRLQQIAHLPVPQPLQEALSAELEQVGDTVRIMTLLETVLGAIRPAAVLGCMEKNRLSVAFQTLQARYGYRLLNFQHGIMPLTHNLDWLQFDRFFVWNPLSQRVVLQDGYRYPESLAVVGNPFWEQQDFPKPSSAKAQEILAWRGQSPLIGAYTQYSADYLTPEVRRAYLDTLFAYLASRPQVKLLIKKHPLETDQLAETMLAQTNLQDRVMICTGRELDLWESFALIQFSTTICSTTLLDSLRVNVPAVALDFTDIIAHLGYGYDQEPDITIIRAPETVPALFDRLLEAQKDHEKPPASDHSQDGTLSLIYPNLPGSYAQRVRAELVAIGLLPASTSDLTETPEVEVQPTH